MGNPLGAGCMDYGGAVEITPIDMILFSMGIALMAMWMDR